MISASPTAIYKLSFILLWGVLICGSSTHAQTPSYSDSLWQEVQNAENDSLKSERLLTLSWEMLFSDPDSGYQLAEDAQVLAKKIQDRRLEMRGYSQKGISLSIRSKNDASVQNFETGLGIAVQENDSTMIGLFLNNLGNVYIDEGNYPRALQVYLRSLSIKETMKDSLGIAAAMNNIGGVYEAMGDGIEGRYYYEKALQIELKLGSPDRLARCYHNLAVIEEGEKHFHNADEYYQKALEIHESSGNIYGAALNYQGIGSLHFSLQEYGPSETNFLKALSLFQEIEGDFGVASAKIDVSDVYLKTGRTQQAKKYALEGLKEAEEMEATGLQYEAHEYLAAIFQQERKFEKAFYHYGKFVVLRDSVQNEDRVKELAQLNMRYEFEKEQEQEKIRKAAEKRAGEETIRQRNFTQYLYIFGGFCLLLIVILILTRYVTSVKARFYIAFLSLMTFYQFLLVLLDPWIFQFTGGIPFPKFITSALLAALFAFISQWVRKWARKNQDN